MFEHQEPATTPLSEVGQQNTPTIPADQPEVIAPPAGNPEQANDLASDDWHADAGRKGALRVQQLIAEGKLYEQEHGLKRGRQRIRQLIELGRRYEQEHGLRPRRSGKRGDRLGRGQRKELLTTLFRCLVRIAKPSFRAELVRLAKELHGEDGQAA